MKSLNTITLYLLLFSALGCTTFEKHPGTIGKQIDLVEDLVHKLPKDDQKKFSKFLENVRDEEIKLDHIIEKQKKEINDSNDEVKEARLEVTKSSIDAGKWKGIRNTFLAILFTVVLGLVIYGIIKLRQIKLPVP